MTHQTDERMDPLKALREELDGLAPSPQFAPQVRQGIDAAAAARSSWLSGWRWLVPAAAAAAIAAAVFVMWRPTTEAPQQVVAQAPIKTPSTSAPAREFREPAPSPAMPRAAVRARTRGPENLSTHLRSSSFGGQARGPENPFPEVITNQPEVLRALWARVRTNATLVESTPTVLPDAVPEIVVNPIEVSPIVVKWLGDPQMAPGTPIIRRVTADMAERSAK